MQQINEKVYKTRHNRVLRMIYWELYEKFKVDHTKKLRRTKSSGILRYKQMT